MTLTIRAAIEQIDQRASAFRDESLKFRMEGCLLQARACERAAAALDQVARDLERDSKEAA